MPTKVMHIDVDIEKEFGNAMEKKSTSTDENAKITHHREIEHHSMKEKYIRSINTIVL